MKTGDYPETDSAIRAVNARIRIEPQVAWRIWEKANELSDLLWEYYESEFLDFCMEKSDGKGKSVS
ncbi:MAG: hypothetical protein ACLFVE_15955 [Chitinispirillaceae bacterium]